MNNQLNQKHLFRIGLLLNKNDGPKTVIISWLINVGFLFYMVFIGWVPGIRAIVANNRSGDMDAAIFGLFYTSGLISMLLCYLSVVPKKRKIMQIFERIDMIENKYYKTENLQPKMEKQKKLSVVVSDYAFRFIIMLPMATLTLILFIGNVILKMNNSNQRLLLLNMSFEPILNKEIFWEYVVISVLEVSNAFTYVLIANFLSTFFVNVCLYIQFFMDLYENKFNDIDVIIERNKLKTKHLQLLLKDIIELHIQIMSLFEELGDWIKGVIFFQILFSTILCSTSVFSADTSLSSATVNYQILFISGIALVVTTSITLAFCYLSTRMTEKLSALGDVGYNSLWYKYPDHSCQAFILKLIILTQRPRYFSGYGIVSCTLEVFGKILKTSMSYYLGFKSLS